MYRITIALVLLWLFGYGSCCLAADYRVGPEDVLEIRFWQDPELNSTVRVRQDGKISLDVVGQIVAAGKTVEDLQTEIVRQMSRLNKRISQAVVQVLEYNYQHVFVIGQVNSPGKRTFEEIPDLLTIVNEAGWITDIGDLSRVTIIRGGDEAGQVEVVDVAAAIANGTVGELPRIHRQDAIEISRTPMGLPPADIGQHVERKNFIYVMGAVNNPGPIQFQENVDIVEALALAGGPSENADLEEAQVITKDGYYAQTIHVDLNRYARTGMPARYVMRKEDVLLLRMMKRGFFERNLGTIVAVLGAATSAVLLYENLKPADEEH